MVNVQDPNTFAPFQGDCDFLDAEILHLRYRAQRIAAQADLRTRQQAEEGDDGRPGRHSVRDLKCKVRDLLEREQELREAIDARLKSTREDGTRPMLGLDRLCAAHRLDPDERMILLALAVPAISPALSEATFGDLLSAYRGLNLAEVVRLLDPQDVAGWVNARHHFDPDGALLAAGLILLEPVQPADAPDGFWHLDARLTHAGFNAITGDRQP